MLKRTLQMMLVLAVLAPAAAMARQERAVLADRLPADAVMLYVRLDVRRALTQFAKALAFVDPESGGKIAYQVVELHGLVKELAANYQFRPKLLDQIADTELYFVLMLEEGEGETPAPIWLGNLTLSVVLRTPSEEVASDFMEEFKAMLEREKAKDPDSTRFDRRDIEVERGELIASEDDATLGRLGEYVIFSTGNPEKLWAALMAPPEKRLSGVALYARLMAGEHEPVGLGIVNMERIFRGVEDQLKRVLDEAEAMQAQEAGEPVEGEWDMGAMQMQMANTALKAFLVAKELFSLDKWEHVGFAMSYDVSEDRLFSDLTSAFSHGEPISPVLSELLDGSGSFLLPRTGQHASICVMARVRLKRILDEVIKTMSASDPAFAGQFGMVMQMMKMMSGVDLPEILDMLASDFYVFVEMVVKDLTDFFGDAAFDLEGVPTQVLWPKVTLLWGLSDPNSARDTLDRAFTTLSTNPQFNLYVKKRTYQETDVFCMGSEVTDPAVYPDGLTSFALVIVDRYLSIGSWDQVSGLIRRAKSGTAEADPELEAVVDGHRDSNLIVVIPKAFQQHMTELAEKMRGSQPDPIDELLRNLDELDLTELDLEDQDLARRAKSAVRELLLAFKDFQRRAEELAPQTAVMTGTHKGRFYEVRAASEMRK